MPQVQDQSFELFYLQCNALTLSAPKSPHPRGRKTGEKVITRSNMNKLQRMRERGRNGGNEKKKVRKLIQGEKRIETKIQDVHSTIKYVSHKILISYYMSIYIIIYSCIDIILDVYKKITCLNDRILKISFWHCTLALNFYTKKLQCLTFFRKRYRIHGTILYPQSQDL